MENSPPGIQTIRAGAGPGAAGEFETVDANVIDPTDGHDSHSAPLDTGAAPAERDLEVRIVSPITVPTPMMPRATNQNSLIVNNLLAGVGVAFRCFVVFFISAPATRGDFHGIRLQASFERSTINLSRCVFLGYQSG
jgi:hypothetical protein